MMEQEKPRRKGSCYLPCSLLMNEATAAARRMMYCTGECPESLEVVERERLFYIVCRGRDYEHDSPLPSSYFRTAAARGGLKVMNRLLQEKKDYWSCWGMVSSAAQPHVLYLLENGFYYNSCYWLLNDEIYGNRLLINHTKDRRWNGRIASSPQIVWGDTPAEVHELLKEQLCQMGAKWWDEEEDCT